MFRRGLELEPRREARGLADASSLAAERSVAVLHASAAADAASAQDRCGARPAELMDDDAGLVDHASPVATLPQRFIVEGEEDFPQPRFVDDSENAPPPAPNGRHARDAAPPVEAASPAEPTPGETWFTPIKSTAKQRATAAEQPSDTACMQPLSSMPSFAEWMSPVGGSQPSQPYPQSGPGGSHPEGCATKMVASAADGAAPDVFAYMADVLGVGGEPPLHCMSPVEKVLAELGTTPDEGGLRHDEKRRRL